MAKTVINPFKTRTFNDAVQDSAANTYFRLTTDPNVSRRGIYYDEEGKVSQLPELVVTPQTNPDDGSRRIVPMYEMEQQREMNKAINKGMNKAGNYGAAAMTVALAPWLLPEVSSGVATTAPYVGKGLTTAFKAMTPSSYTGLFGTGTYNTALGGKSASLAGALADNLAASYFGAEAGKTLADNWKSNGTLGNSANLTMAGLAALPMFAVPKEMIQGNKFLNSLRRKFNKGTRLVQDIFSDSNYSNINDRVYNARIQARQNILGYSDKKVQEANEQLDKLHRISERFSDKDYWRLFDEHTVLRQPKFARHSAPDFSKMTPEQMSTFFKNYSYEDYIKILRSYNPKTNKFEYVTSGSAYDPNAPIISGQPIVKTGNVEIKDFETGVKNIFNIPKVTPQGCTQLIQVDPKTLYGEAQQNLKYRFSMFYEKPESKAITSTPLNTSSNYAARIVPDMPEGYQQALQKNMDYVTQKIVPGSRPFGSTTNIVKGNLGHGSHDYDVIMTEAEAMKHPEFKNFYEKIPGATYEYVHPQVGSIDVNIVRETNGKAYGQRAYELYAQMYPKEFRDLMLKYSNQGKTLSYNLPLDKSAKELVDAYNPVRKGIMDAFGSSKPKHVGRALYYLHYGDINDVREGFEGYANYILGGNYKPSNIPLSEFSNPEVNSALIDELGLKAINKESFINDPERMKLLFDYAIFDKSFLGRGVDSSNPLVKSLTYWYPNTNGGTANGVGLNTVIGGDSGHGDIYATLRPRRMPKASGNSPREVLSSLKVNRELNPQEQQDIVDIAAKHGVTISKPSSFSDFLSQTSGRKGQNYKDLIAEIAEKYNIPYIPGGLYGNATYASLLEDQPSEAIQQLFLTRMDRPQTMTNRDNMIYKAMKQQKQGILKDLENIFQRRITSDQNKWAKENIGKYGLENIISRRIDQAYENRNAARNIYQNLVTDPNYTHENMLQKIAENTQKYYDMIDKISRGLKTGALLTGFGAAGLVGGDLINQKVFNKPSIIFKKQGGALLSNNPIKRFKNRNK